jgi:putative hemolysin
MKTKKLFLWVLLVAAVIIILAGLFLVEVAIAPKSDKNANPQQTSNSSRILISSANFLCDSGKSIAASFYRTSSTPPVIPGQPPIPNGSVSLSFSDGRTMTLNQTISADGGRYANSDESIVFWNKGDTAFVQENGTTTFSNCAVGSDQSAAPTPPASSAIANPASVNCQQKGGQLSIAEKPDGSQYGLCYFGDNMACEEWAMFRGDCPVGGVKTTGYVTDAQKFCAWSGGQTSTASNAVCTFKNGSTCPNDAFYAGTCQP